MQTKLCRRCGQTKALTEFHRDRARKDGLVQYLQTVYTRISKQSSAAPISSQASSYGFQAMQQMRSHQTSLRFRPQIHWKMATCHMQNLQRKTMPRLGAQKPRQSEVGA